MQARARVYPSHPGDRLRDDSRTLGLNPLLLGKGLATASGPLLFRVRRATFNMRRRACTFHSNVSWTGMRAVFSPNVF